MQSIFAKRPRPHHCHRLTSHDAYQHVSGSEIFDSLAKSNKQSRNTWSALGRGRPHRRRVIFHRHRLRTLHVHICCFPTVLSGRRGRSAQVLLWFLSLSSSTGKFSANSVVDFLRKLGLAVLHKFCSRFVVVSTATSRIGPPASTTRDLDMEKHIAQISAQDPHALLVCSCQK